MKIKCKKDRSPENWKLVKLGEYVISVKGKKPKRISKTKTKEFSVPYVTIKAFEKKIIDEYTDGADCVLCEEGDFLMVWDGSRSGYVGKGIKGALGSTLVKLKFPDINNNYAYYFLQSKYLDINTRAKGVGIPHVDPNILWNYDLLIPPLPTQHAIVSKIEELFSELDKGIENLRTAQQQLKTYRQAVLKWAFEGKLTNEKVEDGVLPKGWKWVKVKDIAETYGGYAFKSGEFKSNGKYQVLRMGNVRPGIIRYDESPVFLDDVEETTLNRSLLKLNDVIITQTGTRKKRDYGFTVLITKSNLLLNQRIAAIRIKEKYLPKFLLYFTWTDLFKDQFFENETGNVGQGNVGMKAVTETLIPCCSNEEQSRIVQEIESRLSVADKMEENINQSLQQAEALRQSILKKAFDGNY
jgi:type I restriction enzyme S subunit